jgi:putative phage-type endonuclease
VSMSVQMMVSTNDMDKQTWLELRRKGIGGSDAPVILGLSKWKTAFELWLEKTGQAPIQETDSEAAYWGTKLEDLVAEEFTIREGKKVRRRNAILQHHEYPWMLANVDRFVVGENAILECKTTSAWLHSEWKDDEVPDAYIIQCQHYMAVTGAEKAYVAVLIGGNHYKCKVIPRDEELISLIIEAERRFWEFNVLGNNPPALDGSSAAERFLKERYAKAEEGKVIELPTTYQDRVQQLLAIKAQMSELERQQKAIENELKNELKDAEAGLVAGYVVSWKSIASNRFDQRAFQAAHPDLYSQYVKPSLSRRFEIKEVR